MFSHRNESRVNQSSLPNLTFILNIEMLLILTEAEQEGPTLVHSWNPEGLDFLFSIRGSQHGTNISFSPLFLRRRCCKGSQILLCMAGLAWMQLWVGGILRCGTWILRASSLGCTDSEFVSKISHFLSKAVLLGASRKYLAGNFQHTEHAALVSIL